MAISFFPASHLGNLEVCIPIKALDQFFKSRICLILSPVLILSLLFLRVINLNKIVIIIVIVAIIETLIFDLLFFLLSSYFW